MKKVALALLAVVVLSALLAPRIAPFDYARQFREMPNAPAGGGFLMGTDDLGRDRFSRLLYATRISILLAPAAALVSILLALPISAFAAARHKGFSCRGASPRTRPWRAARRCKSS